MNKEPSYFCVMKYAFSILLILNMFLSQAQITKVKVNTKKNQPNEPSIAINPLNKAEIVAAANIDEIYFSQDTGKTWIEFEAQSDLGIYGDPVLHYANNQLIYTHLSKTSGKKYGDWFDRIVVQKVSSLQPWEEKSYGDVAKCGWEKIPGRRGVFMKVKENATLMVYVDDYKMACSDADKDKLNVNGGAIALGHPLGATGTKLMTTLVHELERRKGKYALQAICEGGGTANATIIERL
mgnify:CR=1 FL=1